MSILRVVILFSATAALIVATFGLVSSIPSMLLWAGITQPKDAYGGGLSEFVELENSANTEVTDNDEGAETLVISPAVNSAAAMMVLLD